MGMFSVKPPFDLTAFLAQKAPPRTTRRKPFAAKPQAPKDESAED